MDIFLLAIESLFNSDFSPPKVFVRVAWKWTIFTSLLWHPWHEFLLKVTVVLVGTTVCQQISVGRPSPQPFRENYVHLKHAEPCKERPVLQLCSPAHDHWLICNFDLRTDTLLSVSAAFLKSAISILKTHLLLPCKDSFSRVTPYLLCHINRWGN